MSQDIGIDHVGTITAQEHRIQIDIIAQSQNGRCVRTSIFVQSGTITTTIDVAAYHGDIAFHTGHVHQGLFYVRTMIEQRIHGIGARIVVIIAIFNVAFQFVGINIRTITATIDIALDGSMNFNIGTIIHFTGDIVTTINVVDFSVGDIHAGRVTRIESVTIKRFGRDIAHAIIATGIHVGHTATAIHIVDADVGTLQSQENTIGIGHGTTVTTRIQVVDRGLLQIPSGSYAHDFLVVTTKHAVYVVIENHIFSIYMVTTIIEKRKMISVAGRNTVERIIVKIGAIVGVNHRFLVYRGKVTTAIHLTINTAIQFYIGLVQLGFSASAISRIDQSAGAFIPFLQADIVFAIVVVTITATIQRGNKHGISVARRCIDDGIPSIVDSRMLGRDRKGIGTTADIARDIVTTINTSDNKAVSSIGTINIDESTTLNIGHTSTGIHIAPHVTTLQNNFRATNQLGLVTATINVVVDSTTAHTYTTDTFYRCSHTIAGTEYAAMDTTIPLVSTNFTAAHHHLGVAAHCTFLSSAKDSTHATTLDSYRSSIIGCTINRTLFSATIYIATNNHLSHGRHRKEAGKKA